MQKKLGGWVGVGAGGGGWGGVKITLFPIELSNCNTYVSMVSKIPVAVHTLNLIKRNLTRSREIN